MKIGKVIEIFLYYPQLKSNSEYVYHQINTEIADFMPMKKRTTKLRMLAKFKGDTFQ